MKKNVYGNIEEIIQNVKIVTAIVRTTRTFSMIQVDEDSHEFENCESNLRRIFKICRSYKYLINILLLQGTFEKGSNWPRVANGPDIV